METSTKAATLRDAGSQQFDSGFEIHNLKDDSSY